MTFLLIFSHLNWPSSTITTYICLGVTILLLILAQIGSFYWMRLDTHQLEKQTEKEDLRLYLIQDFQAFVKTRAWAWGFGFGAINAIMFLSVNWAAVVQVDLFGLLSQPHPDHTQIAVACILTGASPLMYYLGSRTLGRGDTRLRKCATAKNAFLGSIIWATLTVLSSLFVESFTTRIIIVAMSGVGVGWLVSWGYWMREPLIHHVRNVTKKQHRSNVLFYSMLMGTVGFGMTLGSIPGSLAFFGTSPSTKSPFVIDLDSGISLIFSWLLAFTLIGYWACYWRRVYPASSDKNPLNLIS